MTNKQLVIIDEKTDAVLRSSIFPGASDDSIRLAVSYCQARELDVLLKPVHIVPMSVKGPDGRYSMRDVILPGIGLYRIQASRSGDFAGIDDPEYGPDITREFADKDGRIMSVTFPEWCRVVVYKMVSGVRCPFSAKEFWVENYATQKRGVLAPNAIWAKRPYGQIAKCAEAQAERKGWPEVGSLPTAEEMAGKEIIESTAVEPVTVQMPKQISEPAKKIEYVTQEQAAVLREYADETATPEDAVLKKCNAESFETIPAELFDHLVKKFQVTADAKA